MSQVMTLPSLAGIYHRIRLCASCATKFYLCTRVKTIKLSLYFPGGCLAQTQLAADVLSSPLSSPARELLVRRIALRIN